MVTLVTKGVVRNEAIRLGVDHPNLRPGVTTVVGILNASALRQHSHTRLDIGRGRWQGMVAVAGLRILVAATERD